MKTILLRLLMLLVLVQVGCQPSMKKQSNKNDWDDQIYVRKCEKTLYRFFRLKNNQVFYTVDHVPKLITQRMKYMNVMHNKLKKTIDTTWYMVNPGEDYQTGCSCGSKRPNQQLIFLVSNKNKTRWALCYHSCGHMEEPRLEYFELQKDSIKNHWSGKIPYRQMFFYPESKDSIIKGQKKFTLRFAYPNHNPH